MKYFNTNSNIHFTLASKEFIGVFSFSQLGVTGARSPIIFSLNACHIDLVNFQKVGFFYENCDCRVDYTSGQ